MANKGDGQKGANPQAIERSVIVPPGVPPEGAAPTMGALETSLLWFVARAADEITPWGTNVKMRDAQLRQFIPNESYFASALGTVVARNSAFSFTLTGPPRLTARLQDVLNNADGGEGWQDLTAKVSFDLYSQDSGAFVEAVRTGDSPEAEIIGLNHLDAARCWHTGNAEYPVIYLDRQGAFHRLAWYQVATLSEMPVPMEHLPGIQLCALSRLLRAAQVMRNVTLHKEEKTGGRHTKAIHLVQGVTKDQVDEAIEKTQAYADAQGFLRYIQPLVLPTRDAEAKIDLKTLELASLPEGWDEEAAFKLYIAIIAMAFLSDYQEFAPLPGGNLGTSAQSEMLHLKTRGKGPAIFRKIVTHMLNYKLLPAAVTFEYEEQDIAAERDEAEVRKMRAEGRKLDIEAGVLTDVAGRQQALDAGDISQEVFDLMGGEDVTPQVTVEDEAPERGKEAPAKAGPFRRRVGGDLRADAEEGQEGALRYW